MKSILRIQFLALAISILASAQTVPSGMSYQSRLTDSNGNPSPDGTGYEVEVRLWTTATGGNTPIWAARYTGVTVKNGGFNLILGSPGGAAIGGAIADLKTVFATAPTTYLGLTVTKNATGAAVSGATEILPRQQLFSSPYAFRAGSVDPDSIVSASVKDGEIKSADIAPSAVEPMHLADASVTTAKLAPGSVTSSSIAPSGIPFSLINQDFAYFIDEKPQGTSGGGFPSNDIRRTLNKTVYSSGNTITRNGDLITLAQGSYWIDARVPGYNLRHSGSLVNVNTGAVLLAGRHSESAWAAVSEVRGILEVTSPTVELEIKDTILATPAGSSSLGKEALLNAPEKYTEISIIRIK